MYIPVVYIYQLYVLVSSCIYYFSVLVVWTMWMHELFELVTFLGRPRLPYIIVKNYVNVWFPVRSLVYIYIYIYSTIYNILR